jgi:hypothetical protein
VGNLRHFVSVGVGAHSLASHASDHIDVASVVLQTLLSSAARQFLLVLRGLNLGSLILYLTGTCQRSVYFSHFVSLEYRKCQKKGT